MKVFFCLILGLPFVTWADTSNIFPRMTARPLGPVIKKEPQPPGFQVELQVLPKPGLVTIGEFMSTTGAAQVMRGGGISSVGGGDYIDPIYMSAWFYGGAPIKVCRVLAYNFGLDGRQVDASVQKVISFWQRYFDGRPQLYRGDVGLPINSRFEYSGECKGGEDLTLYLGTGPIFQNLTDLRFSQFYRMPVAYPNKNYIGRDLTWAEGYILVNKHHHFENKGRSLPDWSEVHKFEVMLAHEFGHILGFGHDEASIMRDDIVFETFLNPDNKNKTLEKFFGQTLGLPLSNFDLYQGGESPIDSSKLSLLQEDRDIVCIVNHTGSNIRQVTVDRRDRYLTVAWKSGRSTTYESLEFLDSAVLFEKHREAALFQIFQNTEVYLTIGRLLGFRERCETVGAGKECSVNNETFYWSPGYLKLESLFPAPLPVVEYGHYPNDATHFAAHSQPVRMGRSGPALALLDYGVRLELIAGEAQRLRCQYVED